MMMLFTSSIKLPPRPTPAGGLAWISRLWGLARVREKSAFFAAVDSLLRPQPLENKFGGACDGSRIVLRPDTKNSEVLEESLNLLQLRKKLRARRLRGHLQFAAQFEPLHRRLEIYLGEILRERLTDGSAYQFTSDIICSTKFAFVFELELPGHSRNRGVNVGDPCHRICIATLNSALLCAAEYILKRANRKTLADARAAIHALVITSLERDFLHHLANVLRNFHTARAIALRPRFLRCNGHAFGNARGVVRANFRTDAVFQWGDDFSARGVILGVRGEDKQDVERHPDRVALNLHVALLHDIEEANLDFTREIGQFVDRK